MVMMEQPLTGGEQVLTNQVFRQGLVCIPAVYKPGGLQVGYKVVLLHKVALCKVVSSPMVVSTGSGRRMVGLLRETMTYG
mmetsp:Transcript_60002/g.82145  ORF Transcript_60002/g.82145 Transcript_60002/m.82145 type:complete len:80 (+) Transcript_60002:894-1133(+)